MNSWAVEIQIYNVSAPEAWVRVLQRGLRRQSRTRFTAAALRRGEELWCFRTLSQAAVFSLAQMANFIRRVGTLPLSG